MAHFDVERIWSEQDRIVGMGEWLVAKLFSAWDSGIIFVETNAQEPTGAAIVRASIGRGKRRSGNVNAATN